MNKQIFNHVINGLFHFPEGKCVAGGTCTVEAQSSGLHYRLAHIQFNIFNKGIVIHNKYNC